MMARDFDSPVYQRIVADIAEAIDTGELENGDQLPTRPELEEKYGVSRQVVRDALHLLHHEGYVRSQSSKGTYVYRPPRLVLPMYSFERDDELVDSFVSLVERQGFQAQTQIRVEIVHAPSVIAGELGLEDGERALVRRRIRFIGGVPYALADSYFPARIVEGSRIADPTDIGTGGRHILADLGYRMTHHCDNVIARRPHRHEVRELAIAPGCAVIAHNRTSLTSSGQAIRVLANVLPSDRWRLTYEIGR